MLLLKKISGGKSKNFYGGEVTRWEIEYLSSFYKSQPYRQIETSQPFVFVVGQLDGFGLTVFGEGIPRERTTRQRELQAKHEIFGDLYIVADIVTKSQRFADDGNCYIFIKTFILVMRVSHPHAKQQRVFLLRAIEPCTKIRPDVMNVDVIFQQCRTGIRTYFSL